MSSKLMLFVVLLTATAFCSGATMFSVTASAGPGTNLNSTASLALVANTASLVTLAFTPAGGSAGACTPGAGYCQGMLNEVASLGVTGQPGSFAQAGEAGNYQFGLLGSPSNINPFACGMVNTSCSFSLVPGFYTLSASLSDSTQGAFGGFAKPFSEAFTANLNVFSGNIQVAPEPSTAWLMMAPLACLAFLRRRAPVN